MASPINRLDRRGPFLWGGGVRKANLACEIPEHRARGWNDRNESIGRTNMSSAENGGTRLRLWGIRNVLHSERERERECFQMNRSWRDLFFVQFTKFLYTLSFAPSYIIICWNSNVIMPCGSRTLVSVNIFSLRVQFDMSVTVNKCFSTKYHLNSLSHISTHDISCDWIYETIDIAFLINRLFSLKYLIRLCKCKQLILSAIINHLKIISYESASIYAIRI